MIKAAKAEGHKEEERTFNYANEVEIIHAAISSKCCTKAQASRGIGITHYLTRRTAISQIGRAHV